MIKNNLQALRTYRGLTQQELAEKSKVSISVIRKVEKENHYPTYLYRQKIKKVLDFPMNKIWFKE